MLDKLFLPLVRHTSRASLYRPIASTRNRLGMFANRRRAHSSSSPRLVVQPRAQHATWISNFLLSAAAATTTVMLARQYDELFSGGDTDTTSAIDQQRSSISTPLDSRTDSLPIDLERAFALVKVLEELVDKGGTTMFAGSQGSVLMTELNSSSAADYENYEDVVANADLFREKLLELQDISQALFSMLAQKIIARSSERASYTLLKILNEEQFGLQEYLIDNVVLNHPRGEQIEKLMDSFRRLGLLEQKHMAPILGLQHAQAVEGESKLAEEYQHHQLNELPLDPYDATNTMRVLLAIFQQTRSRRQKLKRQCENTVVLPASYVYVESPTEKGAGTINPIIGDWNPFFATEPNKAFLEYDRFFKALKTDVDAAKQPVDAFGILCGSHYTCFTTQIEKSASGQYTVRLLYVDTLVMTLRSFMGSRLVPAIKRAFGEDVNLELYSSVEFTQSRGVGCSYHAPFILERLKELPDWLAKHEEAYAALPANRRLWAYLIEQGKRYESETVIHFFDNPEEHFQENLRVMPRVAKVRWNGCVLPLHVTAENKETLSRRTNVSTDLPVERELQYPFRVTGEIRVGELLAQQGLKVNLEPGSPRAHQQELSTRVYTHLDVTFKDALDGKTVLKTFTRKDGSTFTKRINRGVDVYREVLHKDVTAYLLFMKKDDFDKLVKKHSIEEFEQRVCDRHLTVSGSITKAMRHVFFEMVSEKAPEAVTASAATSHTAK